MRKTRKRVFAAVLAAALLFTMPGMASYAEAEDAQTKDISESVTVQAEDDVAEETEAETEVMQESEAEDSDTEQPEVGEDVTGDTEADAQKPAEEEIAPTQKEDTKECTCGTLCTQDSINGDCPICSAEDADLSRCKGEKTENSSEENKEDAGQEDTGTQDDSAYLCAHHKEHTEDCGYSRASEDGEGSPCTYDCHICPIEDLIAALPDEVTEGNVGEVRAQLNKILDFYRKLSAEEQEQIDLTRCYELQAALDEANAPMTAAAGDVTLTTSNKTVTFTEDECSGNCQGHIITQNTTGALQGATIIVESGTHNVTFSGLNLTISKVGVMPDATMNLTLVGTSMIQGYECGIYVPENATLVINGSGSLDVSASDAAAGIGGAFYDPYGNLGNRNCGTVTINGGTITATGASTCAGIGGAADATPPGNGGTVTINGGTITATGGGDSWEGGAGIGGGTDSGKSGSGGTLTINGGNVTLTAGHSTAYGFGRGSGSNSNAGTLTLADASCLSLTSGTTLDPKGTYSINGDPTDDMIVVPTDLVYTGQTHDLTGKIYIDDSKTGTATYFEQTFNVSASADGWDYTIAPAEVKEAGDYTVTFTKGGKSISTTFTVAECPHTGLAYPGVKATSNNNGTHSLKCLYCGYTEAAENCSYGDYKYNDTEHWKICEVCGYQKTEAHTLNFEQGDTVNGVTTNYERCDCGFFKAFTVTVTVPSGLTYGNTGGKRVTYTVNPVKSGDTEWDLIDMKGNPLKMEGDTLPANLPAGDYRLWIYGRNDGKPAFAGTTIFTVSPATLTGEMVTLSPENATYSGAEQKPTLTVKQGETTLAEGTDYDVTYSTTDFTNAGKVIVTIEGKSNYTGTVEKTYTIKKATLTADGTGTARGVYGAKLSELDITSLTAKLGEQNIAGTWKLTGDTIPGVGDSGQYTATFTPASGAGNYETLTVQVTLDIEKAEVPVPPEGTLYVQNNREQSYQYDLTQILPALDNGKSYGTVSYTLEESAVNISGGYYTNGAKITGTTLTLPIHKVESDKAENIGSINITITSGNYKDMSAVVNVESVDKIPVTITGVSVAEREYNGKAIERTGTPKAVESNGSTATISGDDYHYTWQTADGKDLSGAPKDAGSYMLTVSVNNDTYVGNSTINFVINKASITITADSMTVNKGSAKPALTYTISGLAEGETLAAEPTLTCNADMNTAGRYPITVSGAEVPDSNNYHTEITYVPGALTVTASTSGGSSGGGNGGDDRGNNNGNGSGSENNGDGGQGNSSDNGGGNTTPGVPALPAVTDTNPGTDTETANPGTGNTARPGTGTKPESSTAKEERPDTGIPFIKGEDGKIGWNVIRDEEEKAEEGSVINVDMNGTAVVPGDIFDSIKGRDITITFDMGNGIIWSVDGKSITRDASRDKAEDIDFTVRTGGSAVPVEIVNSCFANNVTGEHYSIQLSLAHDGEFGFIAVLSVGIGEENAGYLASLYYYNEDTGELEFICADEVAQDGTVSFAFTHASDYVVVVDREVEEESGTEETAQPERTDSAQPQDRTDGNGGAVVGSPKEGQTRSRNVTGLIIVGIIALAGIGAGIVIAVKKKKEREE